MSQIPLGTGDRERDLAESAIVLGDLLLDLGVDWHRLGVLVPEFGDQPPTALAATDYRRLPLVDRLRTWVVRHDLAQLDVRAGPVVGALGDCAPRSATEATWHRRILAAVARGEYPSGRAIRGSHHASTSLGPRERSYRAEVLTDLGWVEIWGGDAYARWVAPEGTLHWHGTSPAQQRAARRARAGSATPARRTGIIP